MKLNRVAGLALAAAVAAPVSAHAADAYWNQQCTNGGWTFNTCASAWVTTSGNTVTIRIWNLAGIPGSNTFANAGFTAIGLSSLGSGLTFQNLQAFYPDGTPYAGWDFNNGPSIPGPVGSQGVVISGIGDAIFSQYATSIPGNGDPAITNWGGSGQFGSGYVSFTFQTFTCTGSGGNQTCTPTTINLTNAVLGLHVQSGPNGQSSGYECPATTPTGGTVTVPCVEAPPGGFTPVPEPATVGLMAIGLVSLSAAGFVRRRQAQKKQ